MQTEVTALPIVCSDGCKRLTRKIGEEPRIVEATIKNQTACKNAAILLAKRKQLHPLLGGPYYKNSARVYALAEPVRSLDRNPVGKRVLSAKMLRVKQLQNQLTDAHYHLNELANENRLLKALQKRQDSALQRYEGTNAELPRIINSHHEELRVLQTKYKKLKAQHKDTCDLLKEKENELHALQAQNKHLLQLSKDRNLGEREKLQTQVSDLNHRIKRQNETIQMLHRKLALESKSLKHQLNNEVAKNKIAQRHLNKTMEKLKGLEDLLDNREKKLYYTGQLPFFGKRKNMTTQSLTNLAADGSNVTNLLKAVNRSRNLQDHETQEKSLPVLAEYESSAIEKVIETSTNLMADSSPLSPKTETMTSLDQVRKFRLQKSPHIQKLSARDRFRESINEVEFRDDDNSVEPNPHGEELLNIHTNKDEQELTKFDQGTAKRKEVDTYKLPRQLKEEFGYSTSDSDTENENVQLTTRNRSGKTSPTMGSKELHARLTSKTSNIGDDKAASLEKDGGRPFTEEELEKFVSERLKFNRESILQDPVRKTYSKAECKAEIKQLKAAAGISESDSDCDSGSESNKELEKYNSILRNAPEDSESENLNRHIDFSKFDGHDPSDSETDTEKRAKSKIPIVSKSLEAKSNVLDSSTRSKHTNKETYLRSPDNKCESGTQRLMDITKSWSELQEKIMRERETSENQIKALESELEDDIILKRNNVQRIDDQEIKKRLICTKISASLNGKDILKESIEQKLVEVDKQSRQFQHPRRNSISLGNMNLGIERRENLRRNARSSDKLDSRESQSIIADETYCERSETSVDKDLSTTCFGAEESFTSSIENELNSIDATQAALQSMVLETKKQLNESLKSKSKINGPGKIDNSKTTSNTVPPQESDIPKKDKPVQQREISYKEEMSAEAKMISYNKEKLLAAMKAIDNNENVEFLDLQKAQRSNSSSRSQITENLYRGVPTHSKKKDDLIKELFGEGKSDTKTRNGCTKMH